MGARAQTQANIHVTCVLPGLVWPAPLGKALADLRLPALSALLGQARITQSAGQTYAPWLAAQFGLAETAWANWRWAGENPTATTLPEHLICADPVSLSFTRDALILRGPRDLALTAAECSTLLATLNQEFGDEGLFQSTHPERWYLHARQATQTEFVPLADVLGRPVALFQPEGPDAARWARLSNEIQIVLHNHPVNREREARGQLLVNALWFWGASGRAVQARTAPASSIICDDATLSGLAKQAGCSVRTPQQAGDPAHGPRGHSWWFDTRLQDAALAGDFNQWLQGLEALEHSLLAPLWQAWRAGRLNRLDVLAPSDKTLLHADLKRWQRFAFWRRPLAPTQLGALLETPHTPQQTSGS